MKIPFLDLKGLNDRFETKYNLALNDFFNSGYYILGNDTRKFEKEFAEYCGVKYCIGVGNGYDALYLIFKGYLELGKLSKGDEILVSSNTYIATILAIINADLIPVLVEPDNETYNLDSSKVKESITTKTKGILVTHLYGQLADMNLLSSICDDKGLLLISDSAQAHGAKNGKSKKSGNLADASGFSFYPTKNLGGVGDGGAIVTNDMNLSNIVSQLRNYGAKSKYVNDFIGVNSRLDEIQAAILLQKLPQLDNDNERRRTIAKRYLSLINNDKIVLPKWDGSDNHVFHLFVIRTKFRDQLQVYLSEKGIGTLIHYPIPPHKQKALKSFFVGKDYPIAEEHSNTLLSLPISPIMTNDQVDYIISAINTF